MTAAVYSLGPDPELSHYLREIRRHSMLSAEEERDLARRWHDRHDVAAAGRLATAHLRLVVRIAAGYRGYGLPLGDLISVGSVGMMQAVQRYDPDRGFRFATYAMWWIRAGIQEHVLHTTSLVKMGTTSAQKKLFFNLRRLKARLQVVDDADLEPRLVAQIATTLHVPERDVIEMNRRLAGRDRSLNAPMRDDAEGEWQDGLADEGDSQETVIAERDELSGRMKLLPAALRTLNPRELHILTERRLKDRPATLEQLSTQYGVSRERVRQIEMRALEKLRKSMRLQLAQQAG
jgi:RNA polymerase sigma-32 factor